MTFPNILPVSYFHLAYSQNLRESFKSFRVNEMEEFLCSSSGTAMLLLVNEYFFSVAFCVVAYANYNAEIKKCPGYSMIQNFPL